MQDIDKARYAIRIRKAAIKHELEFLEHVEKMMMPNIAVEELLERTEKGGVK